MLFLKLIKMKKVLLFAFSVVLLIGTINAQVARKALLEEFTNASCGPCASQNPDFNALLDANPNTTVAIKYQTQFPGFDPMNAHNPTEVANRADYYPDLTGVPTAYIDGFAGDNDFAGGVGDWNITADGGYAGGPYGYNQAVIDFENAIMTPISITVDHEISADLTSIDINITVTNTSAEEFTLAQGKLRVALVENTINFASAPGSNGETEFFDVMVKMYPDEVGTDLAAIPAGESVTFNMTEAIPNYIYNYGSLEVVAFVQDDTDKVVYQTEISPAKELVGDYIDAGVASSTVAPTALCDASITPSIVVSNEAAIEITSFDASYMVNGGTPVVQSWTGSIAEGSSETITFDEIMLPGGTTTIDYLVSNVNDGQPDFNASNNVVAPDVFASLSSAGAGLTSLEEDNEANGTLEYPSAGLVSPPIPDGGFGWGTFTVVSADNFTSPPDALGGYGASDQSIWINYYQWNPDEADAADEGTLTYNKVNLAGMENATLTYDRAGGRYSGSNDRLQILISEDCGETWAIVHDIQGADLSTVDGHTEALYLPAANEWETDVIDLSAYDGSESVYLQFKAISAWGNSAFLDNISLTAVTATNEVVDLLNEKVNIFPNPASTLANIEFELTEATTVDMEIYDVAGHLVTILENGQKYNAGTYIKKWNDIQEKGIYFVKIKTTYGQTMKKVTVF